MKAAPSGNQPITSTSRWALPACWYSCTRPWPTPTITLLAVVTAGTTLTLLVPGRCVPPGYTVTYDTSDGCTTVMFNTTAATPAAGTPPRPSTGTSTVALGPNGPAPLPTPSTVAEPGRVSSRRAGDRPTNRGEPVARATAPGANGGEVETATASSTTLSHAARRPRRRRAPAADLTSCGTLTSMGGKSGKSTR